jgi:hypothetical protein
MDWSEWNMDRLYELYRQHFNQLRKDVVQVNSSLGSTRPAKTWMEELTDTEFKTLVTAPTHEPGVVRRWLKCIIRGHEHEFPELRVA